MSIVRLPDARADLKTEQTLATARRVLALEAEALGKLDAFLNESFAKAVDMIAAAEGRVIVSGMGKSGHVGKKIAATFASTGTPAFFIHPAEASHGDMGMIVRGDIILAISNSGEARELHDVIAYAKRGAIPLIAITSRPDSMLAAHADLALLLPVVAEACSIGLAPTTSTTLTMSLGDALAVALLERKGFTAQNFKDIHPGGRLGQQLMAVADIMQTGEKMPLAHESTAMAKVVDIMTEKGFGCILLTDDKGLLTGIVTDGDLRRNLFNTGNVLSRSRRWKKSKEARDIMNRAPLTIPATTLVAEAVAIMSDMKNTARRVTQLAVVDAAGRPVGLLNIHDCLRAGFA
jgi:arabinose-5-phosphate isomerase